MLRTMRPFILPGTMLLLAGVTLLSATADQDAALKDLMPKGMVIGVAVNQRQFEGTDPAAV